MSELRKANTESPYFLTITVAGWIDIFTRNRYCDIIIKNLQFCIENKNMEVFAYVIMPSHLHLVARNVNGNLNHIIRDFKSFTAKQILKMIEFEKGESRKNWLLHLFSYYAKFHKQNKNYLFWQKTNYPIELDYPEIFDQKVVYIHNNPVEAGYVTDSEYWYYSSANPNSPLLVQEA